MPNFVELRVKFTFNDGSCVMFVTSPYLQDWLNALAGRAGSQRKIIKYHIVSFLSRMVDSVPGIDWADFERKPELFGPARLAICENIRYVAPTRRQTRRLQQEAAASVEITAEGDPDCNCYHPRIYAGPCRKHALVLF